MILWLQYSGPYRPQNQSLLQMFLTTNSWNWSSLWRSVMMSICCRLKSRMAPVKNHLYHKL